MSVLVTGGTGFIGSHQVVALIEAGRSVVVLDDGSNSKADEVVGRIERITSVRPPYIGLDIRDTDRLRQVMVEHKVDSILHFAGRKHVPESVEKPVEYFRVNIDGLASVVEAAHSCGVRRLVFSSSGSVYGDADVLPIPEGAPHRPTNPYSLSKSVGESLLRALCAAHDDWSVVALRYFNPAGAHPSGVLGEDPTGLLSNLLPVLMHAAIGNLECVQIWGDDYPTPDGTGVRDYIHVMDVAEAHLRALDLIERERGFEAINIGRGTGVSVRELLDAARTVTGVDIPAKVMPRRPGDVAALYGDTSRAAERLGITRYRDAQDMCEDAWRWQTGLAKPLPGQPDCDREEF